MTPAGFDELYRREFPRCRRIAAASGASPSEAEDIAQEAMIRIVRHWPRLEGDDHRRRWLYRVTTNLAVDRHRRVGRELLAILRLSGSRSVAPDAAVTDVDFWTVVRSLPSAQAKAVALYYALDLSTDDIASVLGIAPGTVRNQLHSARQALGVDDSGELVPAKQRGAVR